MQLGGVSIRTRPPNPPFSLSSPQVRDACPASIPAEFIEASCYSQALGSFSHLLPGRRPSKELYLTAAGDLQALEQALEQALGQALGHLEPFAACNLKLSLAPLAPSDTARRQDPCASRSLSRGTLRGAICQLVRAVSPVQ